MRKLDMYVHVCMYVHVEYNTSMGWISREFGFPFFVFCIVRELATVVNDQVRDLQFVDLGIRPRKVVQLSNH